jgi:hypothetical protein
MLQELATMTILRGNDEGCRPTGAGGGTRTGDGILSDTQLISVTDAANQALGAFDFASHGGKAIRIFLQGFG